MVPVAILIVVLVSVSARHDDVTHLAFDPAFISGADHWLLPTVSQKFSLTLVNLGSISVEVTDLLTSCECAVASFADNNEASTWIPSGESAVVELIVTSAGKENREMEVRVVAVGEANGNDVTAEGFVAVRFVKELNSDPLLVNFGVVTRGESAATRSVKIWRPVEVEVSEQDEISFSVDDPCVVVSQEQAVPQTAADTAGVRVVVAELSVKLDPVVAPSRLKSFLTVRYGERILSIPVVCIIED